MILSITIFSLFYQIVSYLQARECYYQVIFGAHYHGRKEGTLMSYNNAIYSNVYNYYHNLYPQKNTSRFDAHKKSDLKDIYNSIVRISKEDSVFMVDKSTALEEYSIAMKESAMQFRRDISSIGGTDADNLFQQKSVYSSDPDALEAEYISNKALNDDLEPVKITVDSLAKFQINEGKYLPKDQLDIDEGLYSFDVSTPTSNYELQFSVKDDDTNYTIQQRLSRLINNAAIGLSSQLLTNDNDESALVISSTSTGPSPDGERPFTISDEDTSQEKGLIDFLGIKDVTQESSWARYTVNGEEHISPENKIQIDDTYNVTLKKVSAPGEEPFTILTKADYESLKDNIIDVAGAYNQFVKNAAEHMSAQPRTSLLIDSMRRMSSYYSDTMEKLGISRNDDGSLNIDEEVLGSTLKDNITNDDLSSLRDFTKSALRKISRVQINPMDYVDKRIVAYKDPSKTHYANPYMTSAYSGMLFNSYM